MKVLIFFLLLVMTNLVHAQIFRCEYQGEIAFSDRPCQSGAKTTQKKYSTAGASGEPTQKKYSTTEASGELKMQVAVVHYPVEGHDFKSLVGSLKAKGPNGFHGLANWQVSYEYTTKRQQDVCQIDTVITKVDGEILMPRWVDESSATPELRRRWTDYYAALKRHEDGHIQHGRELALLVKERLMGIGAVSCDQVQTIAQSEYQRLYNSMKNRDQEYDARTNHGATQGARFK